MAFSTLTNVQIEDKVEEALARFNLDVDLFDMSNMIVDFRYGNLDLDSIDNLLEYTCKRIVYTSLANDQIQQAKEQCQEYGFNFREMRLKGRDMRKVEA